MAQDDHRTSQPENSALDLLIHRLREGDEEAARQIIAEYEKEILSTIRKRLTNTKLRRTVDSMDIYQSVLANFFARTAAGKLDIHKREQLLGLLDKMVRNKVASKTRWVFSQRRDARRIEPSGQKAVDRLTADQETPSQIAANRELVDIILEQLSPLDRYLVEQRSRGRSWDSLAEELHRPPDALRKLHERTCSHLRDQLDS